MATYAFKAIDFAGTPARGEIQAEDQGAVAEQLRGRGLILLSLEEQKSAGTGDVLARFRRVKLNDLTVATRQFATMISSGMSMLRALSVLEEQVENDKLREALVDIRQKIEAGASLSAALNDHPDIFNELYRAMVAAGETGGILEDTLERVAVQLEKDESLRRQVRSALMYPSVIGGFALLVLVGLVAFLVPVFEKVFEDFGGDLPAITRFTVAMSDFITGRWYLAIGALTVAIVAFQRWKATERGQIAWDSFKLRIPWKIGSIVHKVALARFSRTYSALVAAGVPMLEAIETTGRTAGNKVIERAMSDVRRSVLGGGSIAAPMRAAGTGVFPTMVSQMVDVGEETGELPAMLGKVADFYEDEVAAAIKGLTSIIEPIMIVVVGAIVGFIVIAMYMPMFQVYDQIK